MKKIKFNKVEIYTKSSEDICCPLRGFLPLKD